MTKAEWKAANGFPTGRGRPSRVQLEAEAAYLANGGKWDDAKPAPKPIPHGVAVTAAKAAPVKPQGEKVSGNPIVEPAEPFWSPEAKAFGIVGGKQVYTAMSEACNNCGYSLRWCPCKVKRALVGSRSMQVYIEMPPA